MARYYRKIIHVRAEDSPNVRLALAQRAVGKEPTGEVLVPGVLPWSDYVKRRATWDKVRQCVGLDGQFYEGAELLLFPPDWLNRAARLAVELLGRPRQALAAGIDPGEGGANTAMAVVDWQGLIELQSRPTPDTSVLLNESIAMINRHRLNPRLVAVDRGGGGKQLADQLRAAGYRVQTVAFGSPVVPEPKRGLTAFRERIDQREERYAYTNRRAEMYGELRELLNPAATLHPATGELYTGFALPDGDSKESPYTELRRQLSLIPLLYDREGRMRLPSKNKNRANSTGGEKTLVEILGRSPDEADALVLAVYALRNRGARSRAGALG